jgi:hypothetical protein
MGQPDLTFAISESVYGSAEKKTTVNSHATRKIALPAGTHIFSVRPGILLVAGNGVKTVTVDTVEGMITPVLISVRQLDAEELPHAQIYGGHEYYRSDTQFYFDYSVRVYPPRPPYQPL